MRKAALENQAVLLEAMRSVYSPGFQAVRENLHKLGKIRRVSFQYCQYSRRYDNFKKGIIENAFNPALSNGALMDIGGVLRTSPDKPFWKTEESDQQQSETFQRH